MAEVTDNEINRLVAERVMGWVYEPGDPTFGRDWITHDGDRSRLRDWCTDPAAWAGLLVWLKEQGNKPQLIYDGHDWWASLFARDGWARKRIDADSPGRALALAALRAYGVEVEK